MGVSPDALYRNLLIDLRKAVSSPLFDLIESGQDAPPDVSPREYAAFSISRSLLKKYRVEDSKVRDDAALAKFLTINERCKNWSLSFTDSWDKVLYDHLKDEVWHFFHDLSREGQGQIPLCDTLDEFLHYGRCGPGAALQARGGDFYSKMFASPLTSTRRALYVAYRNYIRNFPEWLNAENIRREHYGESNIVAGNRISFVPKDDKISRTICTEPSLNMFFQLGLGHVIERRLESRYGISVSSQQFKNRELARRGSLGEGYVTCDLTSASDSLGLTMLKGVLPKHVFDMLCFLRSPTSITSSGQTELHMVSTMGNGFTFPLQTMLFSAIVVASSRARGLKLRYPRGKDWGTWGVFGDDIICPDSIWPDVKRLLNLLGFSVNYEKTFVEGPFRESCGSDYFLGRNVRGVYCKSLLTLQERFAVINQLNLFSTRTGIRLSATVQLLLNATDRTFVSRSDNFDSGVMVPYSIVEKYLMVGSEVNPRKPNYQNILYRRYEPIGLKRRILDGRIICPRGFKPLIYNPSGLFVSFLQRSIRSYSIGVRHDTLRYKMKLGVVLSWDAPPTVHLLEGWFNWQRWDTAVYLNLFG